VQPVKKAYFSNDVSLRQFVCFPGILVTLEAKRTWWIIAPERP